MSFANVAAGHKATQIATLTNTGSEPVTITQVALSSEQFAATGIAPTPLTIGPGQSTKFQVSYIGTTSGTASGTLSAMTAHGSGSTKVHLKGSSSHCGVAALAQCNGIEFRIGASEWKQHASGDAQEFWPDRYTRYTAKPDRRGIQRERNGLHR
jgi:hypothetical protein